MKTEAESAERNLGPEWDQGLLLRLRKVVADLGGLMEQMSWGVGGSQEVIEYRIILRGTTLSATGETYMGLVLRGPLSLVEEIAELVSRSAESMTYPPAVDPAKVGTYSALAKAGGGYVWDAVLEYRVWCYPGEGAEDLDDGCDYFHPFTTFAEASEFALRTKGAQEPLALVLQEEYIDEPSDGEYVHVRLPRVTEWPVEFLSRPRRTERTIPDFMAPNAPSNRLDIIRGKGI